jgi:hypothetical protein
MNLNRKSHINDIAVRARLFDQAEFEVKIRNPLRKVPKVVPYEAGAIDRDNDGLVQEGTIWERPVGSRFLSKLGKELASGLRNIPSASTLVDGDGKEIDYKPGDRSMGARGRERRLAGRGQRRLRRADRRLARADRQEARADEIEKLDELIAAIDAAVSEGSRQRLLAAEAIRGDSPMDEEYRSFWDGFIEGFSGVKQRDDEKAHIAMLKAVRLEGERRRAGEAAGNEPDWEREAEFDEIALPDGADLEEHERRMREDPEYREAFIELLVSGEVQVPGQEEAAEEATEDVADAVEDLASEGLPEGVSQEDMDWAEARGFVKLMPRMEDNEIAHLVEDPAILDDEDDPNGRALRRILHHIFGADLDDPDGRIENREALVRDPDGQLINPENLSNGQLRAIAHIARLYQDRDLPDVEDSPDVVDPEADLPDEPTRVRMRPEAMEYLLTQADNDAIHAIIRDEDDGFVAAGLRVDNMDAEMRAEWRNKANWESRRRVVGEMSDEELEQDIETVGGWAENDPFRERWLALYRGEQDRRAVDASAAPEGRGYEFTGQDPNNPWENFDEEGNGRRHEIIRNLSPEERQQIIDSAAGMRAGEHLGPDGTDVLPGWPEAAGPEPMDEEGVYVAAAYAEEFQRYNNFVGEGDLAARLRRDGAGGVAPETPESQGGDPPEVAKRRERVNRLLGEPGPWNQEQIDEAAGLAVELSRVELGANDGDTELGELYNEWEMQLQERLDNDGRLDADRRLPRGGTDPREDTRGEIDAEPVWLYGEPPRFGSMSPNDEQVFEPGWGEQAAGWTPDQQRAWLHADDPDAGNHGEVPQQRRAVERALFDNLVNLGADGQFVGVVDAAVDEWDDQDLNTVLRRMREDRHIENPGGRAFHDILMENARGRGLEVADPDPDPDEAIKHVNWNGVVLDSEAIANRERSIANLNDQQRAQILNGEWPTEALGPRPNEAGMNNAKFYVRRHMGNEGREAGRSEDLGDGLEELDRSGLAERIIAAVQADPVGDNEDRDLMRRFVDRHTELMAEMEGDDVSRFHRGRMEILANMDDNELAEHIERQRNHILNDDDPGDVLRRRTAASELARAMAMRNGRENFDEGLADEPTIDELLVDADGVAVPDEHRLAVNQMDFLELRDEMQVLRNNYDNQPNIPDWVARRYNNLWDEQNRARPQDPDQPRLRNSGGIIVRHPDRPDGPFADDGPEGVGDQPTPDSGVDEVPTIPPVPELSDVPTDLEPINNIPQQNRRRDSNSDAIWLYKEDIKSIQKKLGTRNGVPTWRNDGRHGNGLERVDGHEANVDRALADIDRRLTLLPRGQSEEKRKLQGLKRSLRNLKNNKIPQERDRRQERRDAERAQRQQRHRDFVTAHRELGVFNREWDEADLDDAIANNMDDEAVLARIAADADFLNQHIPNLRSGSWDPDEGEVPSDMAEINRRAREIVAALKAKKIIVNKRKVFRQNREFIGANEPRFREIERHINNMPEDADVPMDMARELLDMKNGILDRNALPRMGASNPDPDLQALIDRKVAFESDIKSLVGANEQRVHAKAVRGVLDEFGPRISEIRADLDNADGTFENQVDVHLAEVQEILNELENLPSVANLATLDQRRVETKAVIGQLHQDLISFRRNVALGNRVDPVGAGGVVHNPDRVLPGRLGGGANPRSRPAGLGLPGHIDGEGNVVIDSVSVGHMGMNVQLDADRHVRGGGDLADVPDAFLGNSILNNAAGLTYPDGESHGPARADNATIGDERFLLVAANKGNIGTTYVLAQRRPDGTVGREGVFIKISKHGNIKDNGDYDALAELVGIEIAHRMGLPAMPGREDGEMLGRGPRQGGMGPAAFAPNQRGRAIILEHAWNGAEDFDDVDLESGFNLARYDVEMQDAMLEGRVGHMMLNWFLGVSDRHNQNGLINIERVTDANGNDVIKGHVYPADLARLGRAGKARVATYTSMEFSMDYGLLDDIRRVVAADPARKEALREQVTEMLNRLQEMINDPNLRERMVNRQEYLAGVDKMRQALNSQFNTVAPNGVLPVDQILSDLGLV